MQAPRTRRSFLQLSALAALPLVTERSARAASSEVPSNRKLKVVCVGGHPDDPESGCGGALIRYAQAGHSVSVVYLTRGERGIRDKGLDEAAKIRTAENEAACKLMGT